MSGDFWLGLIMGFVAAGVVGSAWQAWGLSKKWRAMTKPQRVEVSTSKTPWQVISTGSQAGCVLIVAVVLIAVILWLLLASPL